MLTIGDKIKELRKTLKLTQRNLADQIGVTPQIISNWERGYSSITYENLIKLSRVFRTDFDDFLDGGSIGDFWTDDEKDHFIQIPDNELVEEQRNLRLRNSFEILLKSQIKKHIEKYGESLISQLVFEQIRLEQLLEADDLNFTYKGVKLSAKEIIELLECLIKKKE